MRRSVIWPGLRKGKNGMFDGVIKHYDSQEAEPAISIDGSPLGAITVERVLLDGTLTIQGRADRDLAITRCAFPSPTLPTAVDRWTLRNTGKVPRTVAVVADLPRVNFGKVAKTRLREMAHAQFSKGDTT